MTFYRQQQQPPIIYTPYIPIIYITGIYAFYLRYDTMSGNFGVSVSVFYNRQRRVGFLPQ